MKNRIVLLFMGVLLLSGCIKDEKQEGANIGIGDRLPSLNITLQDGTVINDNRLSGKVSLIMLFSVTCPDCQDQFPEVERVYQYIKDDDRFILFGISREQGKEQVADYWNNEKTKLTFPYSAQEDRYVYSLFATSGVPRIYISTTGRIVTFTSDDKPIRDFDTLMGALWDALETD